MYLQISQLYYKYIKVLRFVNSSYLNFTPFTTLFKRIKEAVKKLG